MSSKYRKYSLERKGIAFGASLSLSIFASLAPLIVQAQVLPEEFEEPVRMQLLPICGKIETQPAQGKQSQSAGFAQTVQSPVHKTQFATVPTQPAAETRKVAKLPVGTFNETQHVKEFSWLSDETNTDATTVSDTVVEKKAKVVEKEAPKSGGANKEHKIDPGSVKVSNRPHCSGVADYYADQFHGRKTASGQLHDRNKFTAAHRTLPFGTKLKVVNRNTGKACVVTVNDRGPFTKSRIIDLSSAAAQELGLMTAKSRLVDCYIVENE